MANTIALAENYAPIFDEVYKQGAKSSILDTPGDLVQFSGANTVKIMKMSMQGLGDYDRSNGFVSGDITSSWEEMTLTQDRGRGFVVDEYDNEETLGMTFGKLGGEFIRTQVNPEVDAYTFAKLAGTTGILTTSGADVAVGTTDCPALVDDATQAMNDEEVSENRILFVSELFYRGMQSKITKQILNSETGIVRTIEVYDGMPIVRVPKTRFYTAITKKDGKTSGQEAGGYTKASGAKAINFMVVASDAIMKVAKAKKLRIFSPEQYQQADAYCMQYRLYHDVFVKENKVKGIYLHKSSTDAS